MSEPHRIPRLRKRCSSAPQMKSRPGYECARHWEAMRISTSGRLTPERSVSDPVQARYRQTTSIVPQMNGLSAHSGTRRNVEDQRLFRRYQQYGDERAREHLLQRWSPLARRLAKGFSRGHEPLEDLEQVAFIGLLKAIERYEIDRGTAFSTFAVPTITGELKRHLRDSVREPEHVHPSRVIGRAASVRRGSVATRAFASIRHEVRSALG